VWWLIFNRAAISFVVRPIEIRPSTSFSLDVNKLIIFLLGVHFLSLSFMIRQREGNPAMSRNIFLLRYSRTAVGAYTLTSTRVTRSRHREGWRGEGAILYLDSAVFERGYKRKRPFLVKNVNFNKQQPAPSRPVILQLAFFWGYLLRPFT
jgi:hypothetical protein